jgi:hypothetical protein
VKGRRGRRRKQLPDDVNENIELEIERESTTSHIVQNSTGKFLCGCRKTHYVMNDYAKISKITSSREIFRTNFCRHFWCPTYLIRFPNILLPSFFKPKNIFFESSTKFNFTTFCYITPDVMTLGQSRSIRWVENVARMGAERNACTFLVGKLKDRGRLEKNSVHERIEL